MRRQADEIDTKQKFSSLFLTMFSVVLARITTRNSKNSPEKMTIRRKGEAKCHLIGVIVENLSTSSNKCLLNDSLKHFAVQKVIKNRFGCCDNVKRLENKLSETFDVSLMEV